MIGYHQTSLIVRIGHSFRKMKSGNNPERGVILFYINHKKTTIPSLTSFFHQDAKLQPKDGASSSLLQKVLTFLSETSGEKEISHLKQQVNDISLQFDKVTQKVTSIRDQTVTLQSKYEDLQKEHLQLMMRRDSWSEVDIQRFADITSSEVHTKRELDTSRIQLKQCEDLQEKTKKEYMDAVRKRYHEEQLWQDKWRVISTYGTWILIGINSIVFLGGQMLHQRREGERIRILSNLMDDKLSRIIASEKVNLRRDHDDDDMLDDEHNNHTTKDRNHAVEQESLDMSTIPTESKDATLNEQETNEYQSRSTNTDTQTDVIQAPAKKALADAIESVPDGQMNHHQLSQQQQQQHRHHNRIQSTINYFKRYFIRDGQILASNDVDSNAKTQFHESKSSEKHITNNHESNTTWIHPRIQNLMHQMKSLVHDTVHDLHTPSMVVGAVTAIAMMTLGSNTTSVRK